MQGQSDYVINGGMQFESQKSGTNFSVLVNRIGRRIFIVGDQTTKLNTWEAPRTLLDFQITQRIIKNLEFKFSASDLLNQYAKFYEDVDDNGKYNASKDQLNFRSRYGTNLSLSVSYKF
jgi:outer membrane receptor protein involved in Fe transport